MATHSSILAWKIPWTEPGGLQSMESQRIRHDWATNTHYFKLKYVYCFLDINVIACLIDYSVVQTWLLYSWDSLYGGICFIAAIWNGPAVSPRSACTTALATAFSSLAWSSVIENSNNCFLQKKYLKTHFGWETGTVINFTWGDNFCPFYGTAVSITDNELPKILIYADLLAPSTKKYSMTSTFLFACL